MPVQCDLNSLIQNSRRFTMPDLGAEDREAIEIYMKVQNLAASGGANYAGNINNLLTAAKGWTGTQHLPEDLRNAISTYISQTNALANGAEFQTDINSLKNAAKCYLCIGPEDKKRLLLFLRCALSNLGKPS